MFVAALLTSALTFGFFTAIPNTEDTWILDSWKPEKLTVQPSKHVVPDLTPDELNKMWSDAPKRNPSPAQKRGEASKIGGKLKGVGGAVGGATVALSGFSLGMDIGGGFAKVVGLPTTGSRSCDLTVALFNSRAGCAISGAPDYSPNADIADLYIPPGWNTPPVAFLPEHSPHLPGGRSEAKVTVVDINVSQDNKFLYPQVNYEFECNAGAQPGARHQLGRWNIYAYDNNGVESFYWNPNMIVTCSGSRIGSLDQTMGHQLSGNKTISKIEMVTPDSVGPVTTIATWYSPENPLRPEELSPIPQRSWQITGMCMAGNPFNVGSAWFEESADWEPLPTIPCDPSAVTISQLIDGYGEHVMATWELPAEVQQWAIDNPDGKKQLDLLRIGGITEPISCFSATDLCSPDWYLEMDKNTKYQCQYGGQPVALSECNVYRPTFNPQKTTQGVRYADKEGRLPEIKPTPVPGGGTVPESQGGECFPSGWGVFNPAEWVLKPIKCAFIPRQSVLTGQITAVRVALANSPIGGLWSLVQPPVVPSGQSCGVIADVNVPNFGRVKIDSCDWSPWAPTVKNFLHWIILAFGFYGIVFWVLRKVTRNAVSEVER